MLTAEDIRRAARWADAHKDDGYDGERLWHVADDVESGALRVYGKADRRAPWSSVIVALSLAGIDAISHCNTRAA